jgi:predicted ATPase
VNDPGRLKNTSLPFPERYWHTTHYPIEDIGIGKETLSIKFIPPEEFGFDTARFAAANVITAICTRVGSENKKADHTDMCHFVRQVEGGVEMRSRFWIGRRINVRMFSDRSPVNLLANIRFIRKMVIPRNTPYQMARHCAQEYNNLAQILPDLYRKFRDERAD